MKNRLKEILEELTGRIDEEVEQVPDDVRAEADKMAAKVLGDGYTVEKFMKEVAALKVEIGKALLVHPYHPLITTRALQECAEAAADLLSAFGYKIEEVEE